MPSISEPEETAIRNVLKELLPQLNEEQIQGVLRRFCSLVNEGHAQDYSFVEAIKRYKDVTTQRQ